MADYNNDCIRRVESDGSVDKILSIHSKPFAIAGSLYVAAAREILDVSNTTAAV